MAELNHSAQAIQTYRTICLALDQLELIYQKDDENLTIETGIRGEDLPVTFRYIVDGERKVVSVLSRLPFAVQEDKRLEVGIAVAVINNRLADGCFDYDITEGKLFFRMTNSFMDSTLGADVFKYMFFGACKIIDEYNDKFLMIAKGMMTVEQLLDQENG